MGDVFKQKWSSRARGTSGESKKWYGEYVDHRGVRKRVPLAADKASARAMLRELERQADRRRSGLADEFTEAAGVPIAELKAAFLADLKLRGRKPGYRREVGQLLAIILPACGFASPADFAPGPLDIYLASMEGAARTRAKHRQAVVGFANFLVAKGKLAANPLGRVTRPAGDEERRRRALTLEELRRLLEVAPGRPLADATLIRWGPRAGARDRKISDAERGRCLALGRNNALLYRSAFYTGLRADELRSLIAADLVDEGGGSHLALPRERTKNKKDAICPVPPALARDLRAWVADRGLAPGDALFRVPHRSADLIRADLAAAGIADRDARGRVVDFHSLRKSLSTHLNTTGAKATVVKELMRHSTIKLSLDTYHDSAMNDGRSAIDALPDI